MIGCIFFTFPLFLKNYFSSKTFFFRARLPFFFFSPSPTYTSTNKYMASLGRSHPEENENRAPELLAVLWTFTTLALVVVLLKVYTRVKIIRETGLDDFLILFSMVKKISHPSYLFRGDVPLAIFIFNSSGLLTFFSLRCFQSFAPPFSQQT